jgi:hypothetical protein
MGKMKEIAMNSEKDLAELTKDLAKDTKELAREHLESEVDPDSITKVVKAVFVGLLEAFKKVF